VTDEAEALVAAQPEGGRQYVQIRAGSFQGSLRERSDGAVALARERWGPALRVRCARPRSYVSFSVVLADEAATWCGIPLGPRSVIELDRDWEITTSGPLEALSFAVERGALEGVEALLSGGEEPPRVENRLLEGADADAERLRDRMASALLAVDLPHTARHALHDDFLYLAARLQRNADPASVRVESWSSRRAAVRRVEEFLDAHEREIPSLAELCAIAGGSERTLEYAFREQLGLPPGRYLRLRRLNHVRRELRAADPKTTRVTDVAMRWGFWQLGRFATEYRALFGERPSETLTRPAGASDRFVVARASEILPRPRAHSSTKA
jgi:AraC family ethanolamine operon transcriptional activator